MPELMPRVAKPKTLKIANLTIIPAAVEFLASEVLNVIGLKGRSLGRFLCRSVPLNPACESPLTITNYWMGIL